MNPLETYLVGVSERPDSPSRLSGYELWEQAELRPAPLSRAAIEEIATSHEDL